MRSRFPALTIWRPWSTLILSHGKDIENRPWRTDYTGPLYIHGGLRWEGDAAALFAAALGVTGVSPDERDHPVGIVGLVDVTGICSTTVDSVDPCACGQWATPGAHHWRLRNPRPLPEPVPCRGHQGLWWPTGQVADGLAEAINV